MKKILTPFLLVAGMLLTATLGHAQILWTSSGTISADSDVLNNGSYFDAVQLQDGHTVVETVNGVAFNLVSSLNQGGFGDGMISTTSGATGSDSYNGNAPISASYQAILTGTNYTGTSDTINIAGLTAGDDYQVEIWLGANSGRTTTYSGAVAPITLTGAQYAVGDVTPVGSTASFTYTSPTATSDGQGGLGEIDAVSVRDITSVPEPSTWVLLMGGAALLTVPFFRRSARI
jgi:hypothetical protein